MKTIKLFLLAGLLAVAAFGLALADNEHRDGYRSRLYGTVQDMPVGRYGTWIIESHEVLVTEATRIVEEYGRAAVGSYVEVKGRSDGRVFRASKLEIKRGTDEDLKHRQRPKPYRGEFRGRIQARTEKGVGIWRIGGREVLVDQRTRLEATDGPIAEGALVEVEGNYSSPSFQALRIKGRRSDP